ncbi:MAG: M13 family metallopeptidase, partial [Pseudobdellovibrionaceae bacterium]
MSASFLAEYVIIFAFLPFTLSCSTSAQAEKSLPLARNVNSVKPAQLKDQPSAAWPKILDELALKDGQQGRAYVDPCNDFYQFACGTWLDKTTIPENKKYVSRQSTIPLDQTDEKLNLILEGYASGSLKISSPSQKILASHYKACMQVDQTTTLAASQVQTQRIDLLKLGQLTKAEFRQLLPKIIAEQHLSGQSGFFNFGSFQDPADSNQVIGNLSQGGISLPDRDYYLKQDAASVKIRNQYKVYINHLFHLFGASRKDSSVAAQKVLAIETSLAKASLSIADRYDAEKTVHPSGLKDVEGRFKNFDWDLYFKTLQLGPQQSQRFNLEEPEFFSALNQMLIDSPTQDLVTYMTWKLLDGSASEMGGVYEKLHFQFWNKQLNGAQQMLPRWKFCTQAVSNQLGYALAEAYVQTFDGEKIKAKTQQMIAQIKSSFEQDLQSLDWLDASTYQAALEKIRFMQQKVGAPEKWRDYSRLENLGDLFLQNSANISRFESRRDLAKIGQAVDKSEWYMMPWEINAYYDPANNEFNFPFGILQPPSVDLTASEGANLGSFGGSTIGHELTHGFDNDGSQYDARGNIKNWWSPQTQQQFEQKSQCFVQQANAYPIKDVNLNVNGEQTLSENLADQGGVKLGYMALQKSLMIRKEQAPWLGRYNERQQYWIAYAQSWCTKGRPEALRVQITSDPHPPAEFRVNAVMMNRPEFAEDFQCKPGQAMVPVERCSVW